MQAIGDPDDDTGDFAEEHEQTEVTRKQTGDDEPASPDREGSDDEGKPGHGHQG